MDAIAGPADYVRTLERCINDLVGIVALPAVWSGREAQEIVRTFLDTVAATLDLDFATVKWNEPLTALRVANLRASGPFDSMDQALLSDAVGNWLVDNSRTLAPKGTLRVGAHELSLMAVRMGAQGQIAALIAGSRRPDFPLKTELLVLNVAANQLAIALNEERQLVEQKSLARELERRVTQRTKQLAETNANLTREIAERRAVEDRLRESDAAVRDAFEKIQRSESRLREVIDAIPALAWCNLPDGPNEFLNKAWHEYTGLSPEESQGWGWQKVFHPEDLPPIMKRWGEMLISGESGQMEARLRRHDGVYRWFLIRAEAFRESGTIVRWYGTSTDIDDLKEAQKALQNSELKLNTIINTTPAMVWTTRPDGFADFFNAKYLDYVGMSQEELTGWGWTKAVHPDDLSALAEVWDASRASGKSGEAEVRMRRSDGEYRWFLMRSEPMRDATGGIIKWFGLYTDIEDRKRAQASLEASERDLRSIINAIPTTAWATRHDGYCEFLNERWLGYAGMTAEEAQGWGWSRVIHPDDVQRLVDYWQSCLNSGSPVEVEARMRRADGIYRWFLFRANPLRDDSGEIVRWFGTNIDIDDRKRAEQQLSRSEEFLREGQELARLGSFSWVIETGEITWSEQLYEIFGLPTGEVITLEKIGTRVHPEDLHLISETVEKARQGVSDFQHEHRLLMANGSVKYVQVIAHATHNEQGQIEYVGAVQDVTQRHDAEAALANARIELANVSRATSMGVLTASIAHEVNQPISGIVTNASACLRMLAADPPNLEGARETARRAIRDGNRAAEVISRLRTLFSRRDNTVESMDLNEAVREVLALSMSELQRSQVILRSEFAEDLPAIRGDRVQLQQVVLNLLRNAADAMTTVYARSREVVVRTEREDGNFVRLSVSDAGIGLDRDAEDCLFRPFYTTKADGMGIGLSISRSIIEAHQGRLWARRNEGPGATFCFSLPCEDRTKAA